MKFGFDWHQNTFLKNNEESTITLQAQDMKYSRVSTGAELLNVNWHRSFVSAYGLNVKYLIQAIFYLFF